MEFYSAIKKKEILSITVKWMELENVTFSEINKVQKEKGGIVLADPIQIQALSYIHIYRTCFQKWSC
jgi:hypothetical protein